MGSRFGLRYLASGRLLVALLLAVVLASSTMGYAAGKQGVMVFAASSLTEAFGEIEREFEKLHPEVDLQTSFNGSSMLRVQIEQGATPEVFASADLANIAPLQSSGYIVGRIEPIANNSLVIIVPAANPAKVNSIADLAHPGLILVACSAEVPIGNYTLQALDLAQRSGKFGPDFKQRVMANFRSLEPNVKGIVTKVMLGDAEAGICYASDVTPQLAEQVKVIAIPKEYNVRATCYAAVVKGCRRPGMGWKLVDFIRSPKGQGILKRHGLMPIRAAAPEK